MLLCLLALAAPSGEAGAAARVSEAQARPSLPPQGLYEGCAPATGAACVERLAKIRAAGFQLVLNYSAWYGSAAEVRAYADAAAALGLQLIWPLNHPAWRGLGELGTVYSSFAEARADHGPGAPPGNAELTAKAIGLAAGHPATWGFYIGDELPAAEAGRVRALSATVRRLAPDKPQLYVARPGAGRLEPFARIADVAGADPYPIGSGDPSVPQAARSAKAAASTAGARTAMVLQAFSWSHYAPGARPVRYPTAADLRAMRNAAIRHAHPSLILWYSYQDILRSDHPQRRWRDLVRAAFGDLPQIAPYAATLSTFPDQRLARGPRRSRKRWRNRREPPLRMPDRQRHTSRSGQEEMKSVYVCGSSTSFRLLTYPLARNMAA